LPAAALFAIAAGAGAYEIATAPKESYKLAMLPIESAADTAPAANRLALESAKQLASIKGGSDTRFTFIAPDRVRHAGVDAFGKAYTKLGVTHVLRTRLDNRDGKLALHAVVIDAHSGNPLPCAGILCTGLEDEKEWTPVYGPDEARYMPVALAGMVTMTLRLPALEVAPVNSAAIKNYQQGVQYTRQGATVDKGVRLLEQAVQEDPDSAQTWAALAEAQWIKFRDPSRTGDSLRQAESRNPDVPAAHRVEGYLYNNEGHYVRAAAELERAKDLQPGDGNGWFELGRAYQGDDKPFLALVAFQKATQVEPAYYRTWRNLGAFHQTRSDYLAAAANFKKAGEVAPDSEKSGLRATLGSFCAELGQFAASEQMLRDSLGRQESLNARFWLGQTLTYERKYEAAAAEFKTALHLLGSGQPAGSTSKASILMYLGIALDLSNQHNEAAAAHREGLKTAQDDIEHNSSADNAHALVGYFDAALGNRADAEDQIARATHLFGNPASMRWRAVLTYEELYRRFHNQTFRDKTLQVLMDSPGQELADFSRWPSLADLQKDPYFLSLLASRPVPVDGGNVCLQ